MKKKIIAYILAITATPSLALAQTWTPLITATDFAGIRADLIVVVAGVMSLILIIFGIVMVLKLLGR